MCELAQLPALHRDQVIFANHSERTLITYALDSSEELWSVYSGHPSNGFNPSVTVADAVVYASVSTPAAARCCGATPT